MVIQRVKAAKVTVAGKIRGTIGRGMLVLIGVENGDSEKDIHYLATKASGKDI